MEGPSDLASFGEELSYFCPEEVDSFESDFVEELTVIEIFGCFFGELLEVVDLVVVDKVVNVGEDEGTEERGR